MRRVPLAKHLRWKLGLTREAFATRFPIPLGTLRDWEQRRREPDAASAAYLKVIATDADFVARAVEEKKGGGSSAQLRQVISAAPCRRPTMP